MIQYSTDVAGVFKALADPTRRGILEQLDAGPATVTALAAPFEISFAAVAQHVQVLERSGLITTTKPGRERLCELNPDAVDAAEGWLRSRRLQWGRRLNRLEEHLDTNAQSQQGDTHDR